MAKRRIMFHTQGYHIPYLTEPKLCTRDDAWLGHGFYYWSEETDAIYWGKVAKKRYKKFSVYFSDIIGDDVLDTVFNAEHYKFWVESMEKVAEYLYKKTHRKPTIADINSYFLQRGGWDKKVPGIMFQDLPANETMTKVVGFYYKKRIQMAVFDSRIIANFIHHFDGEC